MSEEITHEDMNKAISQAEDDIEWVTGWLGRPEMERHPGFWGNLGPGGLLRRAKDLRRDGEVKTSYRYALRASKTAWVWYESPSAPVLMNRVLAVAAVISGVACGGLLGAGIALGSEDLTGIGGFLSGMLVLCWSARLCYSPPLEDPWWADGFKPPDGSDR